MCNLARNGSLTLTEERGWQAKYSAHKSWKIIRGILYVNFITRESMTEFPCGFTAAEVNSLCTGSVLASLLYREYSIESHAKAISLCNSHKVTVRT